MKERKACVKKCFREGKEAEAQSQAWPWLRKCIGHRVREDRFQGSLGGSIHGPCGRLGVLSGAWDGNRWCHSLLQGAHGEGGKRRGLVGTADGFGGPLGLRCLGFQGHFQGNVE